MNYFIRVDHLQWVSLLDVPISLDSILSLHSYFLTYFHTIQCTIWYLNPKSEWLDLSIYKSDCVSSQCNWISQWSSIDTCSSYISKTTIWSWTDSHKCIDWMNSDRNSDFYYSSKSSSLFWLT